MNANAHLVRPAPLLRRLAAALYDSLLVIALWFLLGFVALIFTGGEAVPARHPVFLVVIWGTTALFFIVFWTRGGQTLGMRAWRLQVRRADGGGHMTTGWAVLRLIWAVPSWLLGGIGLWLMLFDSQRRTLHDRLSGTEVILIPPPRPAP